MIESDTTLEEEQTIEAEFQALLDDYSHTSHRQKVEIITRAYHFAKQAHKGVRRRSGEPYIMHPLAVARIVVKEIGLGSTSICAALLHDVVEDTDYSVEDIENLFGEKIAQIVDGLTKISGGVFGEQASVQAENFRKLILTMSEDIRVILIKIADRLHNMRTLAYQPLEKQYKIAGETEYIYAPLANRLGLFPIKTELENLCFKYEHPEMCKEIEDKLQANKDAQMSSFEQFSAPIKEKLTELGYSFQIDARVKSPYSIWKKMINKNVPFEEVYDLLAVRIIFQPHDDMSEKDQCWRIYSALTSLYRPHPGRIRDWISSPKANGYEALHVTVMGQNGQWVEVQIRTVRMHDIAERGLAAHWKYKTGDTDDSELDKWLKTIQEMLKHPEQDAIDFLDTFKLNLFAQEILVFTPKGEIKTMPQGSTALDFAFLMHTQIGEHCIGAKVNHKLVPLSYVLRGGDQVEIITSNTQVPQEEWLSWVTTAKAQARLRVLFRKEETKAVKEGERLFDEKLTALGKEDMRDSAIQKLMKYYDIGQKRELMKRIGRGEILLDDIVKICKEKRSLWKYIYSRSEKKADVQAEQKSEKKSHHIVLHEEDMGKVYVLDACCHPIPGDDVLGYQDECGMIHIHKRNCPQANILKSHYGKSIYTATWDNQRNHTFTETVEIRGIDAVGVMTKVLTILADDYKTSIHDLHLTANDGIFTGTLQIYVHDYQELQQICESIRKVKEISHVQRMDTPVI